MTAYAMRPTDPRVELMRLSERAARAVCDVRAYVDKQTADRLWELETSQGLTYDAINRTWRHFYCASPTCHESRSWDWKAGGKVSPYPRIDA